MEVVSQECLNEIQENLGELPPPFELNGEFIRFGKKKKLWVVGNLIEIKSSKTLVEVASYGDWSQGSTFQYKPWEKSTFGTVSPYFKSMAKQTLEKQVQAKKENHLLAQQECREVNRKRFDSAIDNKNIHPYMLKKGFTSNYIARVQRDQLLVPMYDVGQFNGVQIIFPDGFKKFPSNIKKKGSFCTLLSKDKPKVIYFCEGYATACSIAEAVNEMTVCCFDAGNLMPVIKSLRSMFQCKFIICADNDQWGDNPSHKGVSEAKKISSEINNCSYVYPIFYDGEDKPTDFNDLYVAEGVDEVKSQIIGNKFEKDIEANYWESIRKSGFTIIGKKDFLDREVSLLAKYFSYKFRYISDPKTEEVYYYKDGYYQKMESSYIRNFAQNHYKPEPQKGNEVEEFLKMIKRTNLKNIEEMKGKSKGLINFKNCVYNYMENKILEHSHEYFFFNQIPHNFNPSDTNCPIWDELLGNLTCSRGHLENILLQFLGYCLSGSNYIINNFLILYGSGANGKTSLVKIFTNIVGQENCASTSIVDMTTNRFATADIEDKLINFSEEAPAKKVFAETGLLKKLVGGSKIRVENKGIKSKTVVNRAKIIMDYNEIPYLSDMSQGMKRRMIIVPFEMNLLENPEKKIKLLQQKIRKEASAIINKAMPHLRTLFADMEFYHVPESDKALEDIIFNSDSVLSWFDEHIEKTSMPEDRITYGEMFSHYAKCMNGNGRISDGKFRKRVRVILRKYNDAGYNLIDGPHDFKGYDKTQRGVKGVRLLL